MKNGRKYIFWHLNGDWILRCTILINALYVSSKPGKLMNKFVLCLDLLGNFAGIHTEWKNNAGSGWSPAYTVSSLLINLQAILADLDKSYNYNSASELIKCAKKFVKSHGHLIPEIADEKTVGLAKMKKTMDTDLFRLAKELEVDDSYEKMKKLNDFYLSKIMAKLAVDGEKKPENTQRKVDENIRCYITGSLYTEEVLGYGISMIQGKHQTNLSTPAELLSWSAYKDGQRTSTTKTRFEYFLPAFINQDHGPKNKEWMNCLKYCVEQIGQKFYKTTDIAEASYEIFPRLINTLVMEMFKLPHEITGTYFQWDWTKSDEWNMKMMEKFEEQQVQCCRVL